MNKLILIVCILYALFLSACSVMNTSPIAPNKGIIENQIPYFLPTGRLRIKMFTPEGSTECNMTIEEVYLAERLLFLQYNPSIFSTDSDIKIAVSTEGFLTAIDSKTKDATPEIIVALAKIAKIAMGIPPAPLAGLQLEPCKLDLTFDPFRETEKKHVLEKIHNINPDIIGLKIVPMFNKVQAGLQQKSNDIPNATKGVVYLTRLPYEFKIETSTKGVQLSQMVYLPNESPLFVLEIKRKPFVENSINITFDKGMLTQVKWTKPSEALGFINIPIDVAKAIMAIPGELLTVKVNDLNAEKGFLTAQKEYMEAQISLMKKKAELEAQTH